MRCPECNRWPQLEQADPEINIDLDTVTGTIAGTVRIALTCAECKSEIKVQLFEVALDVSEHLKHECPDVTLGLGWDVEADISASMRQHPPKGKVRTTYYGADGSFKLTCQCGEVDEEIPWSDEVKASLMEELC